MNRSLVFAAAMSAALAFAASAEAKVYDWSYTLTGGGGGGSGTFDAGNTLPALITSATGTLTDPDLGGPFSVTLAILGTDGGDNTIYTLGTNNGNVSFGGISLDAGGGWVNLYSNGATYFAQNSATGASYSIDISITSVPEATTWAMMLLGFAGLGFLGYRKGRHPTVFAA
jgi:hypothetical protein